jgi:hypothetical protein
MVGRMTGVRTVAVFWGLATIAGIAGLTAYANRPGEIGEPPRTWPSDAPFARSATQPTLVVALHPGCGCSKATLAQLERLAGSHPHAVDIVALMARYTEFPADQDVLTTKLSSLADVRRIADDHAALATRFGALTSGHVLLYDTSGRLRFSGGLTSSRGHEGDSAGLDYLRRWLDGQPPAGQSAAPVFGCALAHHPAAAS